MSAFMCSDRHLSLLAMAGVGYNCYASPNKPEDEREAERKLFALLAAENIKSLACRYPRADFGAGKLVDDDSIRTLPPITVIKQCHCYAYQSCEHEGWETSQARKIVAAIEAAAVRSLPDYDRAPWGI